MKSIALALFLGVISANQQEVKSLVALQDIAAAHKDDGIIDALTSKSCEDRLWLNQDELDWQMDQFSRHFRIENLNNALEIAKEMGTTPPRVHAWELNDKAFSFPRVRNYDYVNNNLDMLEHFQDNLNTNLTNKINQQRFIDTATKVVGNLGERYHDGEWDSPANHDPREEEKDKK